MFAAAAWCCARAAGCRTARSRPSTRCERDFVLHQGCWRTPSQGASPVGARRRPAMFSNVQQAAVRRVRQQAAAFGIIFQHTSSYLGGVCLLSAVAHMCNNQTRARGGLSAQPGSVTGGPPHERGSTSARPQHVWLLETLQWIRSKRGRLVNPMVLTGV